MGFEKVEGCQTAKRGMGTPFDSSGFLSVPQLVSALCYHLALQDCRDVYFYPTAGTSKTRDALYRKYKDVAFSQLFRLDQPLEHRLQGGWARNRNHHSDEEEVSCQESEKAENAKVSRLKHMLVQGLTVNGPHGVVWEHGNPGKVQPGPNQVRCDLLMPSGFDNSDTELQTSFFCSEGENVFKFLSFLKNSGALENRRAIQGDWDEQNDECLHGHTVVCELNRGTFVDQTPDPDFVPGPVSRGTGVIPWYHKPEPRGWFLQKQGPEREDYRREEKHPSVSEHMSYNPSRSPVKVSLGSLFLDKSPGKMTFFEKVSHASTGRQIEQGVALGTQDRDHFNQNDVQLSKKDLNGIYGVERKKLWSGEECEIAREALLAMSGVKASLSKLRGRLMMPKTLPRPAIAPILSAMEKASSARASVEYYMTRVSGETPQDPVSYALAHCLKEILNDIDHKLVSLEIKESKNWVQPIGIKTRLHEHSLQEASLLTACCDDYEVRSSGAEFHGTGISILSLAHETAQSRSIFVFLENFLNLEDIQEESECGYLRGRALLENLYEKSSLLEGEHSLVARKLFLAALSPFVSLIRNWAFGVENLNEQHCFVGLLDRDCSIRLPNWGKESMGRWLSELGPSDIPSFFSEECKKSLVISGTQLRLLYSVSQAGFGDHIFNDLSGNIGKSQYAQEEPWFEYSQEVKITQNKSLCIGRVSLYNMSCQGNRKILGGRQGSVNQWQCSETDNIEDREWSRSLGVDKVQESLDDVPLPLVLENSICSVLKAQALIVSQACFRLFVETVDTFGMIEYLRNIFMGFASDFQSEFLRILEPVVCSLEPLTLHKVKSAVGIASLNSCLHYSPHSDNLTVSLLPGENPISLVNDAFSRNKEFSDTSRIKPPFHSAMRPMLVPPSGYDAFDCVNLTLQPSWPVAVILSDDTLTAYSAIFSMNLRLKRAMYALQIVQNIFCGRKMVKQSLSFELVPWIEHFKVCCSFCHRATRHLDAIAEFYQVNCCGKSWDVLKSMFNCREEGQITIHDLIQIHRGYVYQSSGRILTCCNVPSIKHAIEGILDSILNFKGTFEGKLMGSADLESVFTDVDSWQELKQHIKRYDGQIDILKQMYLKYSDAITEDRRNIKMFLQYLI